MPARKTTATKKTTTKKVQEKKPRKQLEEKQPKQKQAVKKQPRQSVKKAQVSEVVLKQEVDQVQKPKKRLKKKYIVFLSLYVLSFILYYSVTSFAKYSSLITKNTNIAVAKWDVSLAGSDNSEVLPTIVIGDDQTYQDYNLTVTSSSEVGITYTVVLTNVPSDLRVTVDGNRTFSPDETNKIVMPDLGTFDAIDGNSTRTNVHTLTFIVPIDSEAFSNQVIDIDVEFSQVAS